MIHLFVFVLTLANAFTGAVDARLADSTSVGVAASSASYCSTDDFDDENAPCQHPRDIVPLGKPNTCTELPDCPSWCSADVDYCGDTSVIKPETITKYATELFLPPVLVNWQNNREIHAIAVREFLQQILPSSDYPKTRTWGYGNPDFWNSEDDPISFHNPAASVEALSGWELKIAFLNDLVEDPVTCRASSDPANCKPLRHILQDCAGVPVVDTKLHWANPGGPVVPEAVCTDGTYRTDCTGTYSYVYDGPVPNVAHVHGAHAAPESDGYTEAWFLPKRNTSSKDAYPGSGNFHKTFQAKFEPTNVCTAEGVTDDGLEVNAYSNDQTSATLFFHDHSLGMTRLNVMAAGAGFYFIRDETCVSTNANGVFWYGETGLDCSKYILPGPPPTAELYNDKGFYEKAPFVNEVVRELPIAIQDMSFYLDTEKEETRQFFPADHDNFLDEIGVLDDADRWGCNNLNGNAAYQNHEIDSDSDTGLPHIPLPVAPIWNPEVFFNVAVVNGRAWPEHQVRPNRYRLRLLNACDSRTLSLSAWAVPIGTSVDTFEKLFFGTELPIWVLGTEQSLLSGGPAKILSTKNSQPNTDGSVTKYSCDKSGTNNFIVTETEPHRGLLMQPGERYDAMIDFGTFKNNEVYLVNTGPDEPFKKFELINNSNRAPFDTLGQLMKFTVSLEADGDDTTTTPEKLCFDIDPGGDATFSSNDVQNFRSVYLKEEETEYPDLGPYAAVLDNELGSSKRGKGWAKPITETIEINHVEEWDVINLSADSHPIHLHQVKFQLVKRCPSDTTCNEGDGVLGYELGWKDAVISYPNVDGNGDPVEGIGFTTTIRMKFDVLGVFVWHCHILSHEDNEMMRPLCVYDPANKATINRCCPDHLVYNEALWDDKKEVQCIEGSLCAREETLESCEARGCMWTTSDTCVPIGKARKRLLF